MVRMSKHGYELKEPVYNQAINDCIYQQGIDIALGIYSKDEVEHHIGGKMYGTKVVQGEYVIEVRHFINNLEATWEQVEPILKVMDKAKTLEIVGTVLTVSTMLLQIKVPWFRYKSGIWNSVARKTWVSKREAEFDNLKSLSISEALMSTPPPLTDSELISWGITTEEVVEYRQAIDQTGFTVRDRLYGEVILALVTNELVKIGIEKGGN